MKERLGRLERHDEQWWELAFSRPLPEPPGRVWQALTDADDLAAWFPARIDGDPAAGAKLRFLFPGGEGPTEEGEVLVYEPPAVLELRWGPTEVLRFELEPDGEGTRLSFVNRFEELGKATRDAAGWHVCLDNLARRLAGSPPDTTAEAWRAMEREYRAAFPAEASTIGPPRGVL